MSTKWNRRAAGLSLTMVALLLLAACGGAASEIVSERPTTATEGTLPTDTALPTLAPLPTATASTTKTAAPNTLESETQVEYQIVTLLPPDAIPAIDEPQFYAVSEADNEYHPLEPVLGVELEGEAKAYSVSLLSSHEIVNDTVAGRPISVTW